MGSAITPVDFDRLQKMGLNLVCLPEYLFVPEAASSQLDSADYRRANLNLLQACSRRLHGTVVGGTLVERDRGKYFNACHVFDDGQHVGFYRKMHPTNREREAGITPGDSVSVFEVRGWRLGFLICADVLFPDSFRELAKLQPDLIVMPTISPFLQDDTMEKKFRRDQEIYVAGSQTTGAYLLKACGVGSFMRTRLQGRSLICSPKEVINRIDPPAEALENVLTAEIDLDKLKSHRKRSLMDEA